MSTFINTHTQLRICEIFRTICLSNLDRPQGLKNVWSIKMYLFVEGEVPSYETKKAGDQLSANSSSFLDVPL